MIRCDSPNHPTCDAAVDGDPAWMTCVNGHTQRNTVAMSFSHEGELARKRLERVHTTHGGGDPALLFRDHRTPTPLSALDTFGAAGSKLADRTDEAGMTPGAYILHLARTHRSQHAAGQAIGVSGACISDYTRRRGITWAQVKEAALAEGDSERAAA